MNYQIRETVGAVWTRIMDDDGHVDDTTPSFANRRNGIG
jgi:hypothetical protein